MHALPSTAVTCSMHTCMQARCKHFKPASERLNVDLNSDSVRHPSACSTPCAHGPFWMCVLCDLSSVNTYMQARSSFWNWATPVLGLIYLISPLDLLPDFIPLIGGWGGDLGMPVVHLQLSSHALNRSDCSPACCMWSPACIHLLLIRPACYAHPPRPAFVNNCHPAFSSVPACQSQTTT